MEVLCLSLLKTWKSYNILIHPEQRWIEIRRAGQEPVTLRDGNVLSVPDLLPGWEVRVDELWLSEFAELDEE